MNKTNPVIPSYRCAHLKPYLDFLTSIGAPVENTLRQFKLPVLMIDDLDAYLPSLPTFAFLKKIQFTQGIDDLSLRPITNVQLSNLDKSFISMVHNSSTLLAALKKFQKFVAIEDPFLKFWITYEEDHAKLCIVNNYPLDNVGLRFEDWSDLMVLIAIVKSFAGQHWQPEEIAFRKNLPVSLLAQEKFPDAHFLMEQKVASINVPRKLLSLPCCALKEKEYASETSITLEDNQSTINKLMCPFSRSLKQILPAYLGDGYPSVELAAELAGISVRTLQRKLKQANCNYSDLIQEARFELAAKLLRQTDGKIIEIAYQLGYEDPAHFSRAFRRLAGVSPKAYRNMQL
jgi:AraC-like DNA-binding protein